MMLTIQHYPDLFVDACIRDENAELLFLSLFGRDTSMLQFFAAFSLKRSEGGLLEGEQAVFTLLDGERPHSVFVTDPARLEKLSGRLPQRNLFGNLSHTWLYDPRLLRPDHASRSAWLLCESADPGWRRERLWALIKELSPLPLLDHWADALLDGLGARIVCPLSDAKAPPVGRVDGYRVALGERFEDVVSAAVAEEVLTLDAGELPNDATARLARIADSLPPPSVPTEPLFELGRCVVTPGVSDLLEADPSLVARALARHVRGDWGSVCASDAKQNDQALASGSARLLSAYPIDASQPCPGHGDNTLWIITEWDRSVTTALLPSEY